MRSGNGRWLSIKREIKIFWNTDVRVAYLLNFFVMSYYVSLRSTLWCPLRFPIKRCSVRLYLQLFVGWLMSYLRYSCLCGNSGVQNILCWVFVLFVFVLCLVCPMMSLSLDCQLLIAPSVFSTVYTIKYFDCFVFNCC
jgi:hypothetical protein